jgi:Xaa-Pro aminopeptidase
MRLALRRGKIDGLLITDPVDVGYLSGFTGEDSFLLILTPRHRAGAGSVTNEPRARASGKLSTTLITDGRYVQQARRECPGIEVHCRYARITQAVAEVLKGCRVRRLGIQGEHVTLQLRDALQAAIGSRKLMPLVGIVPALRITKDESEIRTICRAIRIAERAFLELTAGGAKRLVGRSEREIAAELDHRMRDLGADGPSFETIVAAGALSAGKSENPPLRGRACGLGGTGGRLL